MSRDRLNGPPDDRFDELDPGPWNEGAGAAASPDFTKAILTRVDRVQPFLSRRARLAAQIGRLGLSAALLAVALGLLSAHVQFDAWTSRPIDRPVTTLVSGVADQAERASAAWWRNPRAADQPNAAADPIEQAMPTEARVVRTMLTNWASPIAGTQGASAALVDPAAELRAARARANALVVQAGAWMWRERPQGVDVRPAQTVSLADQVSGVLAGRPAAGAHPD